MVEFDAGHHNHSTIKGREAVSFNITFTEEPGVWCTNDGSTAAKGHGATSITTTGFDIYSEVAEEVYWIARELVYDDGAGGSTDVTAEMGTTTMAVDTPASTATVRVSVPIATTKSVVDTPAASASGTAQAALNTTTAVVDTPTSTVIVDVVVSMGTTKAIVDTPVASAYSIAEVSLGSTKSVVDTPTVTVTGTTIASLETTKVAVATPTSSASSTIIASLSSTKVVLDTPISSATGTALASIGTTSIAVSTPTGSVSVVAAVSMASTSVLVETPVSTATGNAAADLETTKISVSSPIVVASEQSSTTASISSSDIFVVSPVNIATGTATTALATTSILVGTPTVSSTGKENPVISLSSNSIGVSSPSISVEASSTVTLSSSLVEITTPASTADGVVATVGVGDYLIRRNASNTDTIPDTGSDLLLLWDTEVASVGSVMSYDAGTFTLGATGRYLVLCSDQASTTDITNNERQNWKTTLTLAGSELVEGYSTGYIRKASGSQDYITFSAAIIEVTSTTGNGDQLQVRSERIDDSTTGTLDRVADRSGITILKLDDTASYARYSSSATFATSATDDVSTTANIQTELEEDSPFTRTTNTVDIATDNLVLAVYSIKSEDAVAADRSEYQSNLTLASSAVPGSWTQTYIRTTDNTDWGGESCVALLAPSSGDDLTLEIVSRDGGGEDFEVALQLMELPLGAKAVIAEATTGDFNAAATNFVWDTRPRLDDDVFSHTIGSADFTVDVEGDFLVLSSVAATAYTAATRAVPAMGFRVNTTDNETIGASTYNRGTGTSGWGAMASAGLLTGLSASDIIRLRVDRIGTATTSITCGTGAFAALQLSSMLAGSTEAAIGSSTIIVSSDAVTITAVANPVTDLETTKVLIASPALSSSVSVAAAISASTIIVDTDSLEVSADGSTDIGSSSIAVSSPATSVSLSVNFSIGSSVVGIATPAIDAGGIGIAPMSTTSVLVGTPTVAVTAVSNITAASSSTSIAVSTPPATANIAVSAAMSSTIIAVDTPIASSTAGSGVSLTTTKVDVDTPSATASGTAVASIGTTEISVSTGFMEAGSVATVDLSSNIGTVVTPTMSASGEVNITLGSMVASVSSPALDVTLDTSVSMTAPPSVVVTTPTATAGIGILATMVTTKIIVVTPPHDSITGIQNPTAAMSATNADVESPTLTILITASQVDLDAFALPSPDVLDRPPEKRDRKKYNTALDIEKEISNLASKKYLGLDLSKALESLSRDKQKLKLDILKQLRKLM